MSTTITPADQADLDSIAWALGEARDRTGSWLRWRLSGPSGVGRVVRSGESLVLLARVQLTGGELVWQQVDALGDVQALEGAVREACEGGPRMALGPRPAGSDWQVCERLTTWITGPDPFEDLQPTVLEPDTRHTGLAERLAAGGRAPVQTWSGRGVRASTTDRAPARSAAWLTWRLAEDPSVQMMEVATGPEVGPRAACSGWVLVREQPIHGQRTIVVLDLQAQDRVSHYALLKAARRLSWERGGLPVVLQGERMSRRYAFTAGFVPASRPLVRSPFTVWGRGDALGGSWRAWAGDR